MLKIEAMFRNFCHFSKFKFLSRFSQLHNKISSVMTRTMLNQKNKISKSIMQRWRRNLACRKLFFKKLFFRKRFLKKRFFKMSSASTINTSRCFKKFSQHAIKQCKRTIKCRTISSSQKNLRSLKRNLSSSKNWQKKFSRTVTSIFSILTKINNSTKMLFIKKIDNTQLLKKQMLRLTIMRRSTTKIKQKLIVRNFFVRNSIFRLFWISTIKIRSHAKSYSHSISNSISRSTSFSTSHSIFSWKSKKSFELKLIFFVENII